MVKIKVCGITNATDAQLAAKLGVDALGFNFCPESPRFVSRERAKAIIALLPPFVTPVGIFVNEDRAAIRETCAMCGLQAVQLHGEEPPSLISGLRMYKIIKAFRVHSERDLAQIRRYDADAFLLDAYTPGKRGGTGKTFNWNLARPIASSVRVILAGGLTPVNVGHAIRAVQPYAVDVCGGVEGEPGKKDRQLLRAFIEEVQKPCPQK
jgi:phosphoribosylanthranilate isomerase